MPKKHRSSLPSKPQSTPPSSFGQSSRAVSEAASTSHASVNDLITRLRVAQNGHIRPENVFSNSSPRSLPPGLRDVLSVPLPPPPKLRPGLRASAHGRIRRTAGPPAPQSWVSASTPAANSTGGSPETVSRNVPEARVDLLPGGDFPAEGSLQSFIMKKIAQNWRWHVENDGIYVSELPSSLKQKLLSYIGTFAPPADRNAGLALRLFFPTKEDSIDFYEEAHEDYDDVTRLDLSSTSASWVSRNGLKKSLLFSVDSSSLPILDLIEKGAALESWDDAESDDGGVNEAVEEPHPTISPAVRLTLKARFPRLAHLSLSFGSFGFDGSPWVSLLNVATHLSTLTSLSLANWPIPSSKPSMSMFSHIRHEVRELVPNPRIQMNGTESDMSEARSVLRRLSNALYCLKWVDLSGCATWAAALHQRSYEEDLIAEDEFPSRSISTTETGPAWNGAWRNVTHLRLAVNWVPIAYTADGLIELDQDEPDSLLEGTQSRLGTGLSATNESLLATPGSFGGAQRDHGLQGSRFASSRPSFSVRNNSTALQTNSNDIIKQDWDTKVEHEKYAQRRELLLFKEEAQILKRIADQVQNSRRQAKGKYISIDLGSEDRIGKSFGAHW